MEQLPFITCFIIRLSCITFWTPPRLAGHIPCFLLLFLFHVTCHLALAVSTISVITSLTCTLVDFKTRSVLFFSSSIFSCVSPYC